MSIAAQSTSSPAAVIEAPTSRAAGRALQCLLLFILSALIAAFLIQSCLTSGRLATWVPIYDDVGYFNDGLTRLRMLHEHGIGAVVQAHWREYVHSPWSTYSAFLGYCVFGRNLWAPYAINALLLWLLFVLVDRMFRDHPWWVRLALGLAFVSMPYGAALVVECRPDPFCAMLIAAGLWRLAEVPLAAMRPSQAGWVGLIWGATMWVKPTVFVQTNLFFLGALAWGWLQAWFMPSRSWRTLARNSAVCIAVATLVAAPHLLPHLHAYIRYMSHHMFGGGRNLWLLRAEFSEHLAYYTTGHGGDFMFGPTFYVLAGALAATWIVACWRRNDAVLRQLTALTVFCGMCWLLPTLNGVKSPFFGMAFGCLLLFTFLRCCAAWLGGELTVARRPAMAVGLTFLACVGFCWRLPPQGERNPSCADVLRAIQEEVRTRMTRGPATSVVLPNVGHLSAGSLGWQFLIDLRPAPRLFDLWMFPSLEAQLWRIERADLVVVPEPGMNSSLVYEDKTSAPWRGDLIARLDQDERFRLCSSVLASNGKRVLLYERRGPFVGCGAGDGLHPRSQRMVALQPVSRILVPSACQHKASLSLKVRSIVPGQHLTLRAGAQELARLDLEDPQAWQQVNLQLSFAQATRTLELVCSTGRPHQPILEFEEIRLRPSDANEAD